MDTNKQINDFMTGKVFYSNGFAEVNLIEWNSHPAFSGVFLKHLLTSIHTEGKFSLHYVKIEPKKEIGMHIHQGKIEAHMINAGGGICIMKGKNIEYKKGIINTIPADYEHKVIADENGLILTAVFSPALL